ncbi:peptidoglycan DD-metalloendopeptidase family protein [Streptomyces sp. NPDC005752]|uniref:peptidoglycan DD-metalloendopeptidase family protein n=1 Tax=Streptomyces sp. NPDC005752 TaxID=3157065 RepID=UPI0033E03D95
MAATGRHRRYQPSRINRASLTVTVGGAGIALPLLTAASAGAATTDVWEKVAACESTGDWHVNTGNGHYGGLQFTRSTWAAYGGTAFAARADLATKDQQVAVAEKVLDGQGPGAWPTCSVRAGLKQGGGTPGLAPQSKRQVAADARQDEAGESGDSERTTRGAVASKASPTAVPGPRDSYTVARGDSLSGIASAERVEGGWERLYSANRTVVGADPDLILPGQRLTLDVAAAPRTAPRQKAQPEGATPKVQEKAESQSAAPEAKEKADPAPAAPRAEEKATPAPAAPRAKEKPAPAAREQAAKPAAKPEKKASKPRSGFTAPVSARTGTPYHQAGSWSSGYHTGVDFPVPTGTSVKAVASGKVVSAGWAGAYGYEIVVRHGDGRYSQYAHLSSLHVRAGQQVGSGQRIARSGSTGNSTGPHLHFEIRTGPGYGSDIDPLAYLRAGGASV